MSQEPKKYKHGDVIRLEGPDGERVTIYVDEAATYSPVSFEELSALFKRGGTWADIVETYGKPAPRCKRHGQVWCYYPGCEEGADDILAEAKGEKP